MDVDFNAAWTIKPIARIMTDFPSKFGVPRQSGLVESLRGTIVFEPDFRNAESLRGLEEFSHLWIIWGFSESMKAGWSPVVRPPRLGGNAKKGVFATRSPFRPNLLALSVVKIEQIDLHEESGPLVYVSGVDMMSGSPVFDIKPYVPYADSLPDAKGGFTDKLEEKRLEVTFPERLLSIFPMDKRKSILEVLALDPRPTYQDDPERNYGISFAGYDVKFKVREMALEVVEVVEGEK